jgi:hypothetical protein
MSTAGGANRWWENYLVRYLMPSIAGAGIVNWLASIGGQGFKQLLLVEVGTSGLQTPTLVLLFLYGNLFCYVASYPILGFHVTRVIDFEQGSWRKAIWDGYIGTLLLAVAVLLTSVSSEGTSCLNRIIPFLLVLPFTCLQLYRIYLALVGVTFDGLNGQIAKVFAYTYAISRRRGVAEEQQITKQVSKEQEDEETGDKFDEEKEWQKRSVWRRELIDSYRHMREHGNSAFIFLLELILAGLCYLTLTGYRTESATNRLAMIGILFALWAFPALFIHFIGQHIERRFSCYDRKVKPTETTTKNGA